MFHHMMEFPVSEVVNLIRHAQSGSSESLGLLLDRYRNYLQLLASSRIPSWIRSRAGSSDIVQETCVQVHQSIAQFRGASEGEFLAWLRSVLASRLNRLYEQHVETEKRDVRREHSVEVIAAAIGRSGIRIEEMFVDRSPSPSSTMQKNELLVAVSNTMAELPEEYRQVLTLRHLNGMSFPEIADRIEKTAGATRMLWFRAIDRLRYLLSQKGLL